MGEAKFIALPFSAGQEGDGRVLRRWGRLRLGRTHADVTMIDRCAMLGSAMRSVPGIDRRMSVLGPRLHALASQVLAARLRSCGVGLAFRMLGVRDCGPGSGTSWT